VFSKKYQDISIRFNPLSAQAGKPVPPIFWGRLMKSRWKKHFCKRLNVSVIAIILSMKILVELRRGVMAWRYKENRLAGFEGTA
jgi:hypothetical protein